MAKRFKLKSWKERAKANKQAEARASRVSKPWIEYLGKETREQISIIQELKLQAWMQGIDWWHTPSEGKRDQFNAWLISMMGVTKNIPDFIIAESRGGFNGYYLEYKKTGSKIFKADGSPYADMKDQWEFLLRMREKIGVKIDIVESPEKAVQAIKDYLHLPKNERPE